MERSAAVLTLSGITKNFPGVKALDDVNLDLYKGEVHGLVGENGAGKSTLMKILSGVYQPDAGQIVLNGEAVSFRNPHEAQDAGISIIFQEFSLIRTFDVTDNVFLNREPTRVLGHLDKRAARTKARQLLEELGIELDVDTKIEELSVVQQQVVEIVKALSVTASVLIMDEPSAALTDRELKKLFEIIRNLKARGVTVIYISHMLDEIFEIADRVTVLKDGKVMGTREREGLTKDELIPMMVGRKIEDYFPGLSPSPPGDGDRHVLLEVRNLSKGERLKDVSFTLYAGEILGMAGMVGAGRNFLARCILGLEKHEGGEIRLRGRAREIRSIHDAISSGFGYITDDRKNLGILGPMSVKENVTIAHLPHYLHLGFLRRKQEAEDTRAQVELLNIRTPGIAQAVENLSGGNQQKVLISRWLLREPEIFVFSEPTRGIDVGAKAEIYRIMRQVVSTGKSILMISSELPEIIGMSDRILVMRSGRIEGTIDQHEHRATEEQIMSLAVGHAFSLRNGSSNHGSSNP
ncbi:MAG: sugar ABC transporter ATP-binding protein [Spirochaetales bacterium]|nr:sugar ABC transporter ATP-binding protein [Spirochaetales bacterium]